MRHLTPFGRYRTQEVAGSSPARSYKRLFSSDEQWFGGTVALGCLTVRMGGG
jgi:hypothetical protein